MQISDVMYVGLMMYQGFVLFLVKVICEWLFAFMEKTRGRQVDV